MPTSVTASIVLARRALADGRFPLKIRVTYARQYREYAVILDNIKQAMTRDDYDRMTGKRPAPDLRVLLARLERERQRALELADRVSVWKNAPARDTGKSGERAPEG